MDDHGTHLRMLERRLARVERANLHLRRFKRTAVGTALAVTCLLLMGQAPAVGVPDVLAARVFQIVDSEGHVRGSWTARGKSGVALVVLGDDGREAITMWISPAEPHVALEDGDGREVEPSDAERKLFSWGEPETDQGKPGRDASRDGGTDEEEDDDEAFDWDLD